MDDDQRDELRALTDKAEQLRMLLTETRTLSKAHLIGSPSPFDFEPDVFFSLVARAQSLRLAGGVDGILAAKAQLDDMGAYWAGVDPYSKATLGDTDAAGGYLVPNNVVAEINLQAAPGRGVVDLFSRTSTTSAAQPSTCRGKGGDQSRRDRASGRDQGEPELHRQQLHRDPVHAGPGL